MAMALRFPIEFDAALQKIADARHTSKRALMLGALEAYGITETKSDRVMASVERALARDVELRARLADA